MFGSVLRHDFEPDRSNIDFLVEYRQHTLEEHSENFFGLWEALQAIFGRDIDPVEASAIENPYFREAVESTKVPLYVATQSAALSGRYPAGMPGNPRVAAGKSQQAYESALLLRSGIERQLTIIGEAMREVIRFDPCLAGHLPESSRITGFRNVLVHHYFEIDDEVVWIIVMRRVPELLAVVGELLPGETA